MGSMPNFCPNLTLYDEFKWAARLSTPHQLRNYFASGSPTIRPRLIAFAPSTVSLIASVIVSMPAPRSASAETVIIVSPGVSELTRKALSPSGAAWTVESPAVTAHVGAPSQVTSASGGRCQKDSPNGPSGQNRDRLRKRC